MDLALKNPSQLIFEILTYVFYHFQLFFTKKICCCDFRLWLLDIGTTTKCPAGQCFLDMICVDSRFRGKALGKFY